MPLALGLERAGAQTRRSPASLPWAAPSHLEEMSNVDVRIGVTQAPRELTVEMPDDEREDTIKQVEAALGGAVDVLWLTDKRGRRIGVPAAKIAYIELGANDGDRRIGFGS